MESDYQSMESEGLNVYQAKADDTALKTRLETTQTLEQIEMYLNGESWAYNEEKQIVKIVNSTPKANGEGVRAIMSAVNSYINSSTVQGNLTSEEVGMIMNDYHRGMANIFAFHCEEWGINRNDRKSIINFIEPLVFMFVTRTKDNKERESYNMAVKDTGRQIINPRKGGFGLFNK